MSEQEKGNEEKLELVCGKCEFFEAFQTRYDNGICNGDLKRESVFSSSEMCVIGKAYARAKNDLERLNRMIIERGPLELVQLLGLLKKGD